MFPVVYFSNVTGNTHRFVTALGRAIPGLKTHRIPLRHPDEPVFMTAAYILITPTYGGGSRAGGDVPKQVIRFLNNETNRSLLRGVAVGGNTNFGREFGAAAEVISRKCAVPILHKFELSGTTDDIAIVKKEMDTLWQQSN